MTRARTSPCAIFLEKHKKNDPYEGRRVKVMPTATKCFLQNE